MVEPEELELLSRLLDGELPDAESARLLAEVARRPELAEALAALRALGAASAELPDDLSAEHADRLVARALATSARAAPAPSQARDGLLALAGLAACLALGLASAPRPTRVAALAGSVHLAGAELRPGQESAWTSWGALETGPEAAARVSAAGGELGLGPGTLLRGEPSGGLELVQGALATQGRPLDLRAPSGERVRVEGRALLRVEPGAGSVRETSANPELPPGADMTSPNFLLKLAPPTAAAIAASALTLWVVEGHATVTPAGAAQPVELAAGQSYASPGQAGLQPSAAAQAARAAIATPKPAEPTAAPAPSSAKGPETMTREELAAEVASLRAERGRLLEEKGRLEQKLQKQSEAGPPSRGTYYHLPPEVLKAEAEKGELRLRLPQMRDEPLKVSDKTAQTVGLSDEERKAILAGYQRSHERILAGLAQLYRELGGDASAAATLSVEALMREIESKSLRSDLYNAVREAALERAGLPAMPNQQPGPPVTRAYRLLWQEDDRTVDELDSLLGPGRAEGYLNDPDTSHSDWVTSHGPPGTPE